MQSVTLYVTVTVSTNATSYPGKRDLVSADEAMTRTPSMAQEVSTRSTVTAGFETLSPPTDHLPGEITSMPPAVDGSAGMSLTKNALRYADEAITTINLPGTWEGALERIKWVTDTVSQVAEVRTMSFLPILAWLSRISFSASPVRKDSI